MLLCRTHNLARFHKDNSYVGGDKFKQQSKSKGGSEDLSVEKLSVTDDKDKKEEEAPTEEAPKTNDKVRASDQPQTVFTFAGGSVGSPASSDSPASDSPTPPLRPKLESSVSTSSVSSVTSTGSIKDRMKAFSSGSPTSAKCPACGKAVYPADPQVTLDGVKYHKACAKCEDCKCQITLSNFTKVGEMLLCRTHNLARFHKDNSYVGGDKFKHKTGSTGGE
jgi:hypothetical protein